ncbi:methyltransferase family protein [Rheinheimera salexigens]|uniref:Protein-S-isoprenylcysteine methyltransferase n=1 Tax=Rheinheimera salexigens TaxID=1628148 RepID=A0A1E7Q6X8_9GAMM|nr:isoprenylcysteine carboxylmethyltransferase family protein [Rheinheimera salexigens]OEY69896.1 protein-S-isoprenylcysteine methyltransferase [Rheinheimera salexigens]
MNRLEKKLPPVLVVLIVALMMWLISLTLPLFTISFTLRLVMVTLLFLLALVIILAGVFAFKRAKTTVDPRVPEAASELVTSGIYTLTRNPMYLGFAMSLLAWAIYLSSAWSVLMIALFILYLNQFQIKAEERALTKVFGQQFIQYQAKVRRWL